MSYKLGNGPDKFKIKDNGDPLDFRKVFKEISLQQKEPIVQDSKETESASTKLVHTCNKMWEEHNDPKKDPWCLIGIIIGVIVVGVGLWVWFR
jgi:hypothetical protein